MNSMIRRPVGALVALLLTGAAVLAARPPVVYDSDFRGYVPVIDGIERPDLVAEAGDGRVPADPRRAARLGARSVRRHLRRGVAIPPALLPPVADRDDADGSWRWRRKVAIVTQIQVLDETERPVEGARVYRYYDPTFYGVAEDADGARLVGFLRFLPAPNPALGLLEAIAENERTWRDDGFAPVAAAPADFDHRTSPFVRPRAEDLGPSLEFVGTTDAAGSVRVVSGLFNVRERRRFPRAVVPSAIRVGFIVVREGYQPGLSERRFERGGVRESRRVLLIRDRGHAVLLSREFELTERLVDGLAAREEISPERVVGELDRLLARIDDLLYRVDDAWRDRVRAEARTALFDRLFRRGADAWRRALLAWWLTERPDDAVAHWRLARLAAARAGVRFDRATVFIPRTELPDDERRRAMLSSAEEHLERARRLAPRLLAVYPLLDELLARKGGEAAGRARLLRRGLAETPFNPWLRGRLAALLLAGGNETAALDHLRYSTVLMPRWHADLALAEALAQHDWQRGLVERAGMWSFWATGRLPEDLYPRPVRSLRR